MKEQEKFNQINNELLEILIIEYRDNNMSMRKLQDKYKVNRHILSKKLEEVGVKTTKGNHYRTHFHDFNYFESIDSHEKAYWLGFIMADGYIQRAKKNAGTDSIGIGIDISDIETLEKFKKAISATNPIKTYKKNTQQDWIDKGCPEVSYYCRIILASQKTCNDLMDKGVIYDKSLTKSFVGYDKIPKQYIFSYLRGYLDGNGSIALRKTKNIGLQPTLSFASSEKFANWIASFGNGRVFKDKRSNGWTVRFNTKNSYRLLDSIYKDSTNETRMKRKYERYVKIKNDE